MKTLAFVIGNDDYHKGAELNNAVNDATSIKSAFEKLDFDLIYKENFKRGDIPDILTEFNEKISNYDASIFYFAGHGFEKERENYLASIDCQIPPLDTYACKYDSIKLSEIIDIYKKNTNKVNIVIIDACRKNFGRGGSLSFAPVYAPQGTLIAFSTSPDEGASDLGYENNSVYTSSLLKFIGREHLSVEVLFKKVRKTVFTLTNGKQTTWEHTSLINDYYFNTGQAIYSVELPYKDDVVKDVYFNENSDFGLLIKEMKTYNWHKQNLAIDKLFRMDLKSLNKNQLFLFGRNLLQAANGGAFNACRFFETIDSTLVNYNQNGENHLLNGIFYEIYFNPYGQFRKEKKNSNYMENILALRKVSLFNNSFQFIRALISNEDYGLTYIPTSEDSFIDIYINAIEDEEIKYLGDSKKYQKINSINYDEREIKFEIGKYLGLYFNEAKLLNIIKEIFVAPIDLIRIHCNISLTKATFNTEDIF